MATAIATGVEEVVKIAVSRSARLLPGETPQAGTLRRVKMHEFLMSGGIQTGYNAEGKMTYGDPITVATNPVCPWHGEDCEAWGEIVAGRGYWTKMESDLTELKRLHADAVKEGDETTTEVLSFEVDKLVTALELRPRDALALRSRGAEQIAQERAEHEKAKARFQQIATQAAATARRMDRVYAPAGQKSGGNPWDRGPMVVNERTGEILEPVEPQPDRDEVMAAFIGQAVPDRIEIDGEEDD